MWPALATLGAGIMSYMGGQSTNDANTANAERQMQFQQDMFDSRYQRTVADMQAAGLNPMLAYQQGPGNSPGGAMAQMQNAMGAGVNSAISASTIFPQIKQMDSVSDKNSADAELSRSQKTNTDWQSILTQVLTDKARKDVEVSSNTAANIAALTDRTRAELDADLPSSIAGLNKARARDVTQDYTRKLWRNQAAEQTGNQDIDLREQQAGTARLKAQGTLLGLQVPGAQAYSDYYKGSIGQAEPYVRAGEGVVNSAASLFRGGRFSAARGIYDAANWE